MVCLLGTEIQTESILIIRRKTVFILDVPSKTGSSLEDTWSIFPFAFCTPCQVVGNTHSVLRCIKKWNKVWEESSVSWKSVPRLILRLAWIKFSISFSENKNKVRSLQRLISAFSGTCHQAWHPRTGPCTIKCGCKFNLVTPFNIAQIRILVFFGLVGS